ncbi:MAG: hypothetical protein WAV00_06545 [Nocardioides sp.]
MARVRDILYRFRPAGSPGAAGAAGVPVDRDADLAAELAPLFAQLADTERACDALLEQARRDADDRRNHLVESAHALMAAAQAEAGVERAAASSATQRSGEPELVSIRSRAESEAEELRRRADARIPPQVARVVTFVRSVLDLPGDEGRGAA